MRQYFTTALQQQHQHKPTNLLSVKLRFAPSFYVSTKSVELSLGRKLPHNQPNHQHQLWSSSSRSRPASPIRPLFTLKFLSATTMPPPSSTWTSSCSSCKSSAATSTSKWAARSRSKSSAYRSAWRSAPPRPSSACSVMVMTLVRKSSTINNNVKSTRSPIRVGWLDYTTRSVRSRPSCSSSRLVWSPSCASFASVRKYKHT